MELRSQCWTQSFSRVGKLSSQLIYRPGFLCFAGKQTLSSVYTFTPRVTRDRGNFLFGSWTLAFLITFK